MEISCGFFIQKKKYKAAYLECCPILSQRDSYISSTSPFQHRPNTCSSSKVMDGKRLEYKGEEALRVLETLTENAKEVQQSILLDILERNRDTEYLNKYMKGSTDIKKFKCSVPIINYSTIGPYIKRIANGEESSLLSGHPITEMLTSSGTSEGEPKMMPTIAEDLDRRTYLYNLIMPILNKYIPGLDEGKAMNLLFVKLERRTQSGLPIRTVLTSYYKSKHFKLRTYDPFNDLTSPDKTILCTDTNQSMYCQLLAGLIHRHQVVRLGAVFASAFLRAISHLERNWTSLCNDIRSGQLSKLIKDEGCRSAMVGMLSSPNPHLADEIEAICGQVSWKGILCLLWPRAKYIEAVLTGSMAQYIPSLEFYSDGKIPLVCLMYASSECYLGVNLKPLCNPDDVSYTLLPNMAYLEFIPLANGFQLEEEDDMLGNIVDLVDVKLGCHYELVVTTFAGLYRYRIGDVLQVTGFHNNAPQFRFICRRNVVLSVDTDKTSEEDLHNSVTCAKKLLEDHNCLLTEYTSYADTSTIPGHYVLFWEITSTCSSNSDVIISLDQDHVLKECCLVVEECLDYVYRRCRANDKSIGPLEIRVVETGTFDALMDLFISRGGSINQYKAPRCIKSSDALQLLNSRVLSSYFSPRDPSWTPL